MTLLLVLLIGIFVGMRSLTPPAVTAWAAHLGWIRLRSPVEWMGSIVAVALFTILALGELVADKLPSTPSRTAPIGLIARILMGALAGACIAVAGDQGAALGICVGIVGAVIGTYGGYQLRTRLVKALGTPDIVIALVEDLIAIGGSLWVVTRLS